MNVRHFPHVVMVVTFLAACGGTGATLEPTPTPVARATAPAATVVAPTARATLLVSPSPTPECPARPGETWLTIDAKSNIFGAGLESAPDPGGGGGGRLPPVIELPPGDARVVTFACTAGLTDCCSFQPTTGPEGYPAGTDVESAGGISGVKADLQMFLAGVFLGDGRPAGPAPDRLDFTGGTDFKRLEPELGQAFYIGDGKGQTFVAPRGATRLYLGFVDGYYSSGPPGFYDNNRGSLEATVRIELE